MNDLSVSCSCFTWDTEDNKHLQGRTYDFFGNLDSNSIVIIPRGFKFNTSIETENMVETKYAITGMRIMGTDTPILVDGINENGLMGALLNYPNFAVYDTNKASDINVHPAFITTYLLSQCKDIDDVCREAKRINFSDEKIFGSEIKVHFIFSDKSGKAVIIEPDPDGVSVHTDTVGVLTNSPNYKWHEQNIRNYLDQDPFGVREKRICDKDFKSFGVSGIIFPGGYSPTDRFVKVALVKNYAVKGKNEVDGVTRMFNGLSTVYIPDGVTGVHGEQDHFECTLCMSAMCAESLKYYFTLSTNRRVCVVDLSKELNSTEIKNIKLPYDQDILSIN